MGKNTQIHITCSFLSQVTNSALALLVVERQLKHALHLSQPLTPSGCRYQSPTTQLLEKELETVSKISQTNFFAEAETCKSDFQN
jgi:hypothetical protein